MSWNLLKLFSKSSAARIADGVRIYAIGDIHGCSGPLGQLLDRIAADISAFPSNRSILIFLGDYIDRGADSSKVIDQLVNLQEHKKAVFLKGNHESCLIKFLKNPPFIKEWFQYGGLDTLCSYGITPQNYLDPKEQIFLANALFLELTKREHLRFFEGLKLSFTCEDFFFVHAGVRPGVPLDQQVEQDLLWIRNDFLDHEGEFEKIVVHGHTPTFRPEVRNNRINIDTGAYATGRLTCLIIERDWMKFISSE